MRKICQAIVLAMVCTVAASAQQPRADACASEAHRAFDFWIGEWNVFLPNGTRAGGNRIERVLGGCALTEHWTSARGPLGNGTSVNFYDRSDGKWHQTWIDAQGQPLRLSGGPQGSAMVLEGTTPGQGGTFVRQRITWTPNADGSVRQLWETSTDEGKTWTAVFDGKYVKKE